MGLWLSFLIESVDLLLNDYSNVGTVAHQPITATEEVKDELWIFMNEKTKYGGGGRCS